MTLPIAPVTLPADLVGQPNGRLPTELLVDVGPSGLLHHTAARGWRALVAEAAKVGLPLTYTYGGTYRTLAAQTVLFESRYSPSGTGGGCKMYNGQSWCKKSANLATAAVPSTSNHGLGIAIDSAAGTSPANATGISSHPQWPWFRANAERFGFSWELQSEPWHIRWIMGDMIPQAVLDHETPTPPPAPQPQGAPEMILLKYTKPGDTSGAWTGMVTTGTHLAHIVNSYAWAIPARAGAPVIEVTDIELDGYIEGSQTTTPPPPEFSAGRQAAWNARRA